MRKIILSTSFAAMISMASMAYSAPLFAGIRLIGSEETALNAPEAEPFVLSVRQSRLHIEISSDVKNSTISMFDILGNKVFEMPANEAIEYSVANLKTGIYFIVLKGGKVNFTRKFLHKQEG